jgi:protein-tyrosine-phosphatase
MLPTARHPHPAGVCDHVAGEGIPDPYGLTMAAYRSTLRQLYEYVERVVDRL